MTVERVMKADAKSIYEAWTEKFDRWFAEPGEIMMVPEVDRPFLQQPQRLGQSPALRPVS